MNAPPGPRSTFDAFVYTCKAALAAVAAFLLCLAVGLPGEVWAAVSALIVIQPSLHPSLRASFVRVAANLIAALVGGVCSQSLGYPLLALIIGIMTVGMIIHHTRLDEGLRAGYAAVAIITLTPAGMGWAGPLDRVLAVLIGCVCAVLVNVLGDKLSSKMSGPGRPLGARGNDME